MSWLDSDGKDNGKWSILGVDPKEIICSRDINNLHIENNPFFKLKTIEKGFWIGWLNYEAGAYIEPKNPDSLYYKKLEDTDIETLMDFKFPSGFVNVAKPIGWEYKKDTKGEQEKCDKNKIIQEGPYVDI